MIFSDIIDDLAQKKDKLYPLFLLKVYVVCQPAYGFVAQRCLLGNFFTGGSI